MILLVAQTAFTIWYQVLALNIMGAVGQGVMVLAGYYAWLHDMNITLIVVYGFLAFILGAILAVEAILPVLSATFELNVFKLISSILMPCSDLAGAFLSMLIHKDWKEEKERNEANFRKGKIAQSTGGFLDGGLGLFGAGGAGAAYGAISNPGLFQGQGHTLGGLQGQAAGYLGGAQSQAKGYLGSAQSQAQGYLGGAQAQAEAHDPDS